MQSTEPTPNGNGVTSFEAAVATERDNVEKTTPRTLYIVLEEPIEWNGNTYEDLRLEEPTMEQMIFAEKFVSKANFSPLEEIREYQLTLVSRISGVPKQALLKMRAGQFEQAAHFFNPYGPLGRRIGLMLLQT